MIKTMIHILAGVLVGLALPALGQLNNNSIFKSGVAFTDSDMQNLLVATNDVDTLEGMTNSYAQVTMLGVVSSELAIASSDVDTLEGMTNSYLASELDPHAVLATGARAMSGNLDMGLNQITNIDTLIANQFVVGQLYDPTDQITLVYDVDGRRMTNIVNIGFADGTVQTTAPAGGVGVGDDLYYQGGTVKFYESDVPISALYDSNGDLFLGLDSGTRKIMYSGGVKTNMDLVNGIIYSKTSGKKFLDLDNHSIYGDGGFKNIDLGAENKIRDSAGHDILRFMNEEQALMYDGGTVKAFSLDAVAQIKNWDDVKILDLSSETGLYGANGNQIVGLGGAMGYHINDSAGEKFIHLTDGSEAIFWGAGANMFFDPSTAIGINYNDGSVAWDMGTTYSIHSPASGGIAVDLANWQLQIVGTKTLDWNTGQLFDPSDGTTLIMDWNTRRLTNIVNVAFADGTVQTTASAGGGGGGAGASYSEDFVPGDFDAVTNLTITHNLGETVIAQIYDASSNQFFTGLQLQDDNAVFDMHLLHSTTGFVVVAAGTNTVNFSEFLTSGNVGSNDLDTATDTAYRSGGGGSYEPQAYFWRAGLGGAQNNLAAGVTVIDLSAVPYHDVFGLVDASADKVWLNYGNKYDGSTNVWEIKSAFRIQWPVDSQRYVNIISGGSAIGLPNIQYTTYGVGGQYVTLFNSVLLYATNSAYVQLKVEVVGGTTTADLNNFAASGRWVGKYVTTNDYVFLY